MPFDNVVRVYDKNMNRLAVFDGNAEGATEEDMQDMMVAPIVHIEQNGASTFSFQMLAGSQKWNFIKDPENIYVLNDRYYTALSESAFEYSGKDNVRIVKAVLSEIWYLLDRKYSQVFNCSAYVYCGARFMGWVNDCAKFRLEYSRAFNPGRTLSRANAWSQVKKWTVTDSTARQISYAILKDSGYEPAGWENPPSAVFFKSIGRAYTSGSEEYIDVVVESMEKGTFKKKFEYTGGSKTFTLDVYPPPTNVTQVVINRTVRSTSSTNVNVKSENSRVAIGSGGSSSSTNEEWKDNLFTSSTRVTFESGEKDVSFVHPAYSQNVTVNYTPSANETVNHITIYYTWGNLGTISSNAICTFGYGAEAIDDHSFTILPKADPKYKLTINSVEYDDSQVKDSRGVVLPRGSGGYAMWAALKDTGWSLGVCDVLAKGFDPSEDYGVFNIESDMKSVLDNIRIIQELYGGILDWNSQYKTLNYRAENYDDYQAYNDGFNEWTGMEFREGKNMTALPVVTYDNKIITRAYPLGYGNLNIKNVNSGLPYIDNHSYTNDLYIGYLNQPLIFDTNDESGQKQLLYWAEKELEKQCKPRKSVSFKVTDLRTSEGYEHEIFDINDIVRVIYRDEVGNTQIIDEKRIILWEYNAFAMWDCTVELGDKVQNLIELFRLLYNSKDKIPGSNASGEISAGNVIMTGGTMTSTGNPNSLQNGYQYISQTTTDNSNAIAGLVVNTSNLGSDVQLFAYYQKETDKKLSETYAGITLHADENSARLQNYVTGKFYDKVTGDLKEVESSLTQSITNVNGRVNATNQSLVKLDTAFGQASSELKISVEGHGDTLTSSYELISQVKTDTGDAISGLQGTIDANTEKIDSTVELINKVESAVGTAENNLTFAINSTTKGITSNVTLVNNVNTAIGNAKQQLSLDIQKNGESIKSVVELFNKVHNDLYDAKSGLLMDIQTTNTKMTSVLNLVNKVESDWGTGENGLYSRIEETQTGLESTLKLMNSVYTEYGSAENGIYSDIKITKDAIESALDAINSVYTSWGQATNGVMSRIVEVEGKVTNQATLFAQLDGKVAGVQASVSALEGDIDNKVSIAVGNEIDELGNIKGVTSAIVVSGSSISMGSALGGDVSITGAHLFGDVQILGAPCGWHYLELQMSNGNIAKEYFLIGRRTNESVVPR